jgi:hypothetical protein
MRQRCAAVLVMLVALNGGCSGPGGSDQGAFDLGDLAGLAQSQRSVIQYNATDAAEILRVAESLGMPGCAACVCLAFHESAGVYQLHRADYPLHNVCLAPQAAVGGGLDAAIPDAGAAAAGGPPGGDAGSTAAITGDAAVGCERRSCCAGRGGVLECGSRQCDGSGDIGAFQIACDPAIRRCGNEVYELTGNARTGLELMLAGLHRLRLAGHWPASAWKLDERASQILGDQASAVRAVPEPEKRFLSGVYYQPDLACERGQADEDHVFCRFARAWLHYYNGCGRRTDERCRRRLAAFVRNAGSCFAQQFPERVAPR